LEPERDNICAAITAGDACLRHPSVRQHDLGLLGFGRDLLRPRRYLGLSPRIWRRNQKEVAGATKPYDLRGRKRGSQVASFAGTERFPATVYFVLN
jgi:hypothetical protein